MKEDYRDPVRLALMAELNAAAEKRRDDCPEFGLSGHYFVMVYPENRWQCTGCPETRERTT